MRFAGKVLIAILKLIMEMFWQINGLIDQSVCAFTAYFLNDAAWNTMTDGLTESDLMRR